MFSSSKLCFCDVAILFSTFCGGYSKKILKGFFLLFEHSGVLLEIIFKYNNLTSLC